MMLMTASAFQRITVVLLALATGAGALGVALVLQHDLHTGRAARADEARRHIADSVRARAYYLEDVADMVGVHDDADATEFSRYAHVRGRDERAIVGIQWLRRSPDGRLQPPRDTGPEPILVPATGPNAELVDAAHAEIARQAVRTATLRKRVSVSAPVALGARRFGFYLAVPVEARRFSGEVSKLESRSAIVGLVDTQKLIAEANARGTLAALRLSDGATSVAAVGPSPDHLLRSSLDVGGRKWTLAVAGGALSPFQVALPWLVLAFGLALTLAVALTLRNSLERRDAALGLVRDRSEQLAVSLRRVEQTNHELEHAHAEADRLSRVDPLTGVYNRRHFSERLLAELAAPHGSTAVLLFDLDHFKSVNDRFGHLIGDAVLRAASDRIDSVVRATDCLARWGGEEFAVLAPGTDREGATLLAERARSALAEQPVELEGIAIELTVSAGVAVLGPESHSHDLLLDAADEALYEAKRAGRNCVRVFQQQTLTR